MPEIASPDMAESPLQLTLISNNTIVLKDFSDLSGDAQFAYVTYSTYAAICAITFVVLAIIMVKVILKVGSTDKIIPAMLAMLQLSAISKWPNPFRFRYSMRAHLLLSV